MKYRILLLITLFAVSCTTEDVVDEIISITEPVVTNPVPEPEPEPEPEPLVKVPCENGFAEEYPCNGYGLQLLVTLNELSAGSANDSWGWVDTQNNKEYALVGLDNGTAFVDITDFENAVYLGKLPVATSNSSWRDVKVYNNHAFIVSEAGNHGMQVFDLTRLRNVNNAPETFSADARYTGFGNCHNIVINEESGFAYAVGSNTYGGGPHFVNIQDPKNPIAVGGHIADGYSHDAMVVNYTGPDTRYTGNEIYIGSNEDHVAIVDVTNKTNPVNISTFSYSNAEYTHQAWITPDHRYLFVGDELDERKIGNNTRILVFDLLDLQNPVLHTTYFGPTKAIDHNLYIKDDLLYLSNYTAGVRVLDISQIDGKTITEVGYFDTFPSGNSDEFKGVWSLYPFLPSGNIIISDINRGLFVIKKQE